MSAFPSLNNSLEKSSPWLWGLPAFSLIAILIIGISGSNRPLFLFLNELFYVKGFDAVWINITLFGDAAMVLILLLPLIAKRPDIVMRTAMAGLITSIVVYVLKDNIDSLRPPAIYAAEVMHQLGNQFSYSSFPSGHASGPFTLASMIIFLTHNNKIRSFVLIYASIVALSRIATGVHWPIDILAGAGFGWLSAYITLRYIPVKGTGVIAQRIITLLLLYAAYYLIFVHTRGDVEARFVEVLMPTICVLLSLKGLKMLFVDPLLSKFRKNNS